MVRSFPFLLMVVLASVAQGADRNQCESYFKEYELSETDESCADFAYQMRAEHPGFGTPGSPDSRKYDAYYVRPFGAYCAGGNSSRESKEAVIEGLTERYLEAQRVGNSSLMQRYQLAIREVRKIPHGFLTTNRRPVPRDMRVPLSLSTGIKEVPKDLSGILDEPVVDGKFLLDGPCLKGSKKEMESQLKSAQERHRGKGSKMAYPLALSDLTTMYEVFGYCLATEPASESYASAYSKALGKMRAQYDQKFLPAMMRGESGCLDLIVGEVCGSDQVASVNALLNPQDANGPSKPSGCECSVKSLPDSELRNLIKGYQSKSLAGLKSSLKKCEANSESKTISDQREKPGIETPSNGNAKESPELKTGADSPGSSGKIR